MEAVMTDAVAECELSAMDHPIFRTGFTFGGVE